MDLVRITEGRLSWDEGCTPEWCYQIYKLGCYISLAEILWGLLSGSGTEAKLTNGVISGSGEFGEDIGVRCYTVRKIQGGTLVVENIIMQCMGERR